MGGNFDFRQPEKGFNQEIVEWLVCSPLGAA